MSVKIVEMTFGTTIVTWLCEACQDERKRGGWALRVLGKAPPYCDDCIKKQQREDRYGTPTLTVEPTRSDARLTTPDEHIREKPPAETWAQRLERLNKEKRR